MGLSQPPLVSTSGQDSHSFLNYTVVGPVLLEELCSEPSLVL